jgi:hypothetical protein
MPSSGTATVAISGTQAKPICRFTGSSEVRIHPFGHVWLKQDNDDFELSITISTPGFTFARNATPLDGTSAFWVSQSPHPQGFDTLGGVFDTPQLDGDWTTLTIGQQNTNGGVYYYKLIFWDRNKKPWVCDPIIINKID